MKHNFLKKLMALLLSTFMVLSLVPAITFTANATGVESVTFSFTSLTGKGSTKLDSKSDLTSYLNKCGPASSTYITKATATNVYDGNGSGGWKPSTAGLLKFGASGKDGILKLTFSSNVNKVEIVCHAWTNNGSDTVKVNEATAVKASTTDAWGTVSFDITPSKDITITTNDRVFVQSITVYFDNAGSGAACEHTNKVAIGDAKDATCTEDGITAGVKCLDCGETLEAQETIPMIPHNYDNNVCTECGSKLEGYVLVTDASTLKVGDKIIIVNKANSVALSTTWNKNNISAVSVDITDGIASIVDRVQIITLEVGYKTGTFAFNAGGKYLCTADGGNYLRTKEDIDKDSSWTIDINATDGLASVVATDSDYRSYMQFNPNTGNNNPLFACYSSASQSPVSIYKLVEETTEPTPEPAEAAELKTLGLTLNKGITVKVKLDISAEWFADHSTDKVIFSNGTECVVTGAGEQVFTTELTPAQFADALTVTYGDLTEVVSVAKYKELVVAKDGTNTKLINLLDAIIKYGEVASGAATIEGNLDSVEDLDVEKKDQNLEIGINATLSESATINLSFSGADVNKFVITKNDAPFAEGEITDGKLVLDKVFPNTYDDKFTLTVYNGTTEVATVKFTVNAYFKELAKQYPSCANIAVAAYQYGLATEAYLAK